MSLLINFDMKTRNLKAFSIIELLIAMTVFLLIAIPVRSVVSLGYRNISYDNAYMKAVFYAEEGIEAARFIRAASWGNLDSGTYGIDLTNDGWDLVEDPQTENGYTRSLIISDVFRDGSGNISDTSGMADPNTKKVESKVSWSWLSLQNKEVSFVVYLTNGN
ncbi:hypothetical protein COV25_03310 [candidate division WWE3 bacterium CG10_big_fil_rev_8_21_14_0_10_35_32]|nr:MAG: hypothetical protein COV25_03310 [candidate division WWE3 bacterium CG10_big_fil_rev_8_21_14_0_10_35_32]